MGDALLRFGAEILLVGTAAMALDLLVGVGGLVFLAGGAVFGVAAYAAALAALRWGAAAWLVLPVGMLAGAALAAIIGLLVSRSSSLVVLVLTLLLGEVVAEVIGQWRAVTGGTDGLRGLPALVLGPWPLAAPAALFALAAAVAALGYAVLRLFLAAPAGRALLGTRESAPRMAALGYRVVAVRLRAMLLFGCVAGAAGALYPFTTLYLGPQTAGWGFSATLVVMLVIGGTGSLWGAFPGAAVFLGAQHYLSSVTERWQLLIGLLFVGTVLFLPRGIAGGITGAVAAGVRAAGRR